MEKNHIGIKILLSAAFIFSAVEQGNSMSKDPHVWACSARYKDKLELAMRNDGLSPNLVNENGYSLLYKAANSAVLSIVVLLLEYHADINIIYVDNEGYGMTPLDSALCCGEVYEFLRSNGAKKCRELPEEYLLTKGVVGYFTEENDEATVVYVFGEGAQEYAQKYLVEAYFQGRE
jgi:hypothetical protein